MLMFDPATATEEQIIEQLKEADRLLAEYRKIVEPVAKALARHLNELIHEGAPYYDGELGCWEEGIDSICCHVRDEAGRDNDEGKSSRRYEWERQWWDKLRAAGVGNIHLSSHG